MFIPIGDLIRTLPRRSRVPEAILALHVRGAFSDCLKKVCADLPAETVSKVETSVFKNGVLTIVAPQLVCAELSMRSEGLVKEINKTLGRRLVNRLRFRVS